MDPLTVFIGCILMLLALLFLGVHIALALASVSVAGVYLLFGSFDIALEIMNQASYGLLRNPVFAAIPLFILMGELLSKCGIAADLYKVINFFLRRLPGRLAVATVFANAMFAAVSGISVASAMAFSRIAYPQMRLYGYRKSYALGAVAGSASLGMLIPPSVLMIVWGITTEYSIGKLFLAGVIPGIVMALLMASYCVMHAILDKSLAPEKAERAQAPRPTLTENIGSASVVALILVVLGGMYAGVFTPSESAAVGFAGAAVLAYVKGLRWPDFRTIILEAGRTVAPIMMLLVAAGMYSKFLAIGGVGGMVQGLIEGLALGVIGATLLMVGIWLVLGMFIDSISIILLTVPIFWPLALSNGWDPNAFAIFGILAIECGMLTPPFGILVFTVKGSVPDPTVSLSEIFRGSLPYWLLMLAGMGIIWMFPGVASLLAQ